MKDKCRHVVSKDDKCKLCKRKLYSKIISSIGDDGTVDETVVWVTKKEKGTK